MPVSQGNGFLRCFQNGCLLFIGEGLRSPHAKAGCLIAIEVEAIDRMSMAGQWLSVGVFTGELRGAFAHFARRSLEFTGLACRRCGDERPQHAPAETLRERHRRAFVNRDAAAEGELHPASKCQALRGRWRSAIQRQRSHLSGQAP